MTDREKVIDELKGMVKVCAIYGDDEAIETLNSAISLLKEREPRVITLEELQAIGVPWDRNTPPYLFVEERSGTGSRWIRWMSWGFIHDGVRAQGTMGVQNYGSKWRVWNLEPTPEQMRDTPWEGDNDAETS